MAATSTYQQDVVRDLDREVGRRVRAAREQQGITQEHLAAVLTNRFNLPIHQTMMGKIEKGVRPLKLKEAVAISMFLSVDLAELVFGEETEIAEVTAADRVYEELAAIEEMIVTRMRRLRVEAMDPIGERAQRRYLQAASLSGSGTLTAAPPPAAQQEDMAVDPATS
jgi:transcriptional regulator with XRE-family HTH domain